MSSANDLCDSGFATPVNFRCKDQEGGLAFQAIELTLPTLVEIANIETAPAAKHPFIINADERVQLDQFCRLSCVDLLAKLSTRGRRSAFSRSALGWRHRDDGW